ncbi:MAG TPA: hypothetical protein VLF67_05415, partial [Candidatus Saccharimonas sp.]|nr:hypothetical protein [Candidatus Saccharimonas sp.]
GGQSTGAGQSESGSNAGGMGGAMRGAGAFVNKNKKKFGIGGGIASIIITSMFGLGGLSFFKLIHLREVMDGYFGGRTHHAIEHRIGTLWRLVADKDGNLTYEKSGFRLRDHIYNIQSRNIVSDLKAKGLNVDLDPTTHRIRLDGQPISGSLSDRRSVIRTALDDAYPEDGYFKRSIRAQRTFKIFGIKRTFFENAREKVDNWERELKQKVRNRLFGSDTADSTIKATVPEGKEGTETNKALQDLNDELGQEAEALREDALASPDKPIPDVNVNLDAEELAKAGGTDAAKGALSVTAGLSEACNVKNLMTEVKTAAVVLRMIPDARFAGLIFVAADQLKNGDQIPPAEVNALMVALSGIDFSDGVQQASGMKPPGPIANADKYGLDLTKERGGKGFFVSFSNKLDALPGVGGSCTVLVNPFFQVGSAIVTLAGDFFTGGGVSITGLAISASVAVVIGGIEQILKPMAIQMLAGMAVNFDEPGDQKGDALYAGSGILYGSFARQNGGHDLTPAETAVLDDTIAKEQAQDRAHQSLAYKLFNLNNPRSMLARLAFITPSTWPDAWNAFSTYTAAINPFRAVQNILQPNGLLAQVTATASAGIQPVGNVDGMGLPVVGFTDAQLDRFPNPIDNENYIAGNPDIYAQFQDYTTRCQTGETPVAKADLDYCDGVGDSQQERDLKTRFQDYQLDLGIAGGMDYMTRSTPSLPDDDTVDGGGGTPVLGNGNPVALASQILASPRITFECPTKGPSCNDGAYQDLVLASRDQPTINQCGVHTSLSPALLEVILALSQRYTFRINAMVSDHACDKAYHPLGRAVDIGLVNGNVAIQDVNFYRSVASYIFTILPAGGGLGQQANVDGNGNVIGPCMGDLPHPTNIRYFPDTCNHLHIDVGGAK